MLQLILATGNENKVREVNEILADDFAGAPIRVRSMKSVGISSDPEENGTDFEENALIKARAAAALLPPAADETARAEWMRAQGMDPADALVVISDDSGLVIDALGGAPGIQSARYLGRDVGYDVKMAHILEELRGLPQEQRSARFVAAIAAVLPDGSGLAVRGTMEGRISKEPRGEGGFGYDPILFLPEYGLTSAELSPEEKNAISHRGKGMRLMLKTLRERLAL
nr:RdgB/HAM1 family non-canonical purine NTP pyrophosphatase [Lachnoclostridium sp. Marseille-P6806]